MLAPYVLRKVPSIEKATTGPILVQKVEAKVHYFTGKRKGGDGQKGKLSLACLGSTSMCCSHVDGTCICVTKASTC